MTSEIGGSQYFRDLLALMRHNSSAIMVGLTMVPQEGRDAGEVSNACFPEEASIDSEDRRLECKIAESLRGDVLSPDFGNLNDYDVQELSGQFGTPIAYLWSRPKGSLPEEVKSKVSRYILDAIEKSKKSYFHDIFMHRFNELSDVSDDNLLRILATAIKNGLFCKEVIVWKKRNQHLVALDRPELAMVVAGSLAGDALGGGRQKYEDFSQINQDRIQHRQYLLEHGLRSGFLLPIRKRPGDDDEATAVVGVFYQRPNGTTDIDADLCSYAISYYQTVWSYVGENREKIDQLEDYHTILPFYREAVRALIEFHDLNATYRAMIAAVDIISSLAHNRPDILEQADSIKLELKDLRQTIQKSSGAVAIAQGLAESVLRGDGEAERVNLRELFETQTRKIRGECDARKIKLTARYSLDFDRAKVRRSDYESVITNLLTNALRAVMQRTQGGAEISIAMFKVDNRMVAIRVVDNGVGIAPQHMSQIFDPHFTTHGPDGGAGFGLTKVRSIARKHGAKEVRVESVWGHGATFEVLLQYSLRGVVREG